MSHRFIDEIIGQAVAEGRFDDLPGAGKPIDWARDEFAGDDRMALNMLRSNGFLPEWLQLRKEIWEDRPAVDAALTRWRTDVEHFGSPHHPIAKRSKARYDDLLRKLNEKIDLHNLRCPTMSMELVRAQEPSTATWSR